MPWNPRREGYAEGDQCVSSGSFIPFATTEADRTRTGDPRASLRERYESRSDYVGKVRAAALALEDRGLMLPEDVDNVVRRAEITALFP